MTKKGFVTRSLSLVLALVLTLGAFVVLAPEASTVSAAGSDSEYDPAHLCVAYAADSEGHDKTLRLAADDIQNSAEMIAELKPGEIFAACLAESFNLGSAPLVYPGAPGTFVVLCTGGGCEMKGTVVNPTDEDGRTVGGVFLVSAENHDFGHGHEDVELLAANNGYIDFIEAYVNYASEAFPYGPYSDIQLGSNKPSSDSVVITHFALVEDTVIDDSMWVITEEIAALAADQLPLVICKNGHELTISDEILAASVPGAIKIVDCISDAPMHVCGTLGEDSLYVSYANMERLGERLSSVSAGDVVDLWLAEDVDVGEIVVPSGVTLNVCLNGHELTYSGEPEMAGGVLNIFDCAMNHWCHSAGEFTETLCTGTLKGVLADIESAQSGDTILLHLGEDVTLDAEIPEGVKVGICENGHTLSGSILENEGVYVYDCDIHFCAEKDTCIIYVDQAWADMNTQEIDGVSVLTVNTNGAVLMPTEDIVLPEGTYIGSFADGSLSSLAGVGTVIDASCLPTVSFARGEYTITGLVGDATILYLNDIEISATKWSFENVSYSYTETKHTETILMIGNGIAISSTKSYTVANGTDLSFVMHKNEVISETESQFNGMTVSGELDLINYVDVCSCGVTHDCAKTDSAVPLTAGVGKYLFGPDGNLRLNPGKYEMYIPKDTLLESVLRVPFGVELTLCLDGHTLMAEFYEGTSQTKLYHYDSEKHMMVSGAASSGGTSYTVKTTVGKREGVYDTIRVERGATLTVVDCLGTGAIYAPSKDNDMTTLAATDCMPITNDGSLHLDGVRIPIGPSLFGLNNRGSLTVSGGEIGGVFTGIAQSDGNASAHVSDGAVVLGVISAAIIGGGVLEAEGAEFVSPAIGIISSFGEMTFKDCTLNAGNIGIISAPEAIDFEVTNPDTDSTIVIDGGEINIGGVDRFGELTNTEIDKSIVFDQGYFVGLVSTENLVIAGDFTVNIDPLVEAAAPAYNVVLSDIVLSTDANLEVDPNAILENVYSIALITNDGNIPSSGTGLILPANGFESFVGAGGFCTVKNEDGNYVIMYIDPSELAANSYGWEFYADGSFIATYYVALTDGFVNDAASGVVLEYKGETVTLGASDLVLDEEKTAELAVDGVKVYAISIEIAAKDYKEKLVYHFEDSSMRWGYGGLSMNSYFSAILEDSSDTPVVNEFILALRSYCMAASELFDTTDVTAEDVSAVVGSVEKEQLEGWKRVESGEMVGFKMHSATLLLEERCAMRFYLTLDPGVSIDDIKITVDGAEVKATAFSAGYYCIEIDGVGPGGLGTMRTVTVGDYSFTYSPLTWAYNILSKSDRYTSSDINVAVALFKVYTATQAYMGN